MNAAKEDSMSDLFEGGFEQVKINKQLKKETKPLKTLKEMNAEEAEGRPVKEITQNPSASPDPFFGSEGFQGGVEEGLGKLLNTVTDPSNIKHFTELDDAEVIALSAVEAMNQKMRSPTVDKFCQEFREHRVSTVRKGRNELVEIARAMLTHADAGRKNFMDKLGEAFR